jgi:toxin ParE1/3/4
MVKIIWSKKASNDLKNIYKFISQNSVFYAKKTRDELYERTHVLKDYPEIGKIVPEFEVEHIRELIEGNYRIIYKISSPKNIEIVTVWHSARDLRKLSIN